jgi:UDP-glucuronate decarboxylase
MHPQDGRVVSNFIVQALQGRPITVYGDGTQTRSFCYVDDLIDGFLRLMATDPSVTGPVNLGNPKEFTIRQLADVIRDVVGSAVPIVELPLPRDDPRQRQPDITLARALIGWEPTIQLRQGIEATVAYFDQLLSSSKPDRSQPELRQVV